MIHLLALELPRQLVDSVSSSVSFFAFLHDMHDAIPVLAIGAHHAVAIAKHRRRS